MATTRVALTRTFLNKNVCKVCPTESKENAIRFASSHRNFSSVLSGSPVCRSFVFCETKSRHTQCRNFHSTGPTHKQDYYEVLGVSKGASQKEIKKAYYQLAKKYHPDTNKGDKSSAKKFQEVAEAYEVLGDESKRKQYDTYGMSGGPGGGRGPGQGFQGFEGYHSNVDPEDLFRKIFEDMGYKMGGFDDYQDFTSSPFGFRPAQEYTMNLTFEEAARGVNKDINVNTVEVCSTCNGSKAEPGSSPRRCHVCNGTGMETVTTGPFMMRSTCRTCRGTRMVIDKPCSACNGKGSVNMRKQVTVPVPAGVEDGQTVRMPVGQKEIFISFRVSKSQTFRRDGADVHSDTWISLSQAVLGGTVRIRGIYDSILLSIPEKTSSHTKIRLAGKGISRLNSYGYGDHYVHIKIKVPTKLTEEQKSLMLAFAETEDVGDGTINGVIHAKKGPGGEDSVKGDVHPDSDIDDSFLGKIKKKIFG
ncbi:protein tumorous imaginal discs, mitochondrial-like isoform X1 [Lingula anatina]|uniref:Protein tumorous imaginal discs, mitochondrial-like isoform X1 n=1 Tax=Lingula anatina TaxID=7574 RepID=A0A1S3HJS5_LINAN|nr:protein tumorous imaginal discs, mitochondrial-like isoform X1 [Lingula anatina]XP_013385707.1 protein tumorous imaginal discs, mitochondrial-like isoform X1 [Lingula anatina]|eukprot:XP_013385706.1 protein tumorous imaginal discs, mitochondrial-like isoform X1 [Lingula anatina]